MHFMFPMYSKIICFLALSLIFTTVSSVNPNCKDLKKHKNFRLLPQGDQCPDERIMPRIMGGVNSGMGEFPWIVILFMKMQGFKDILLCTGSIINNKYVITAAHCLTSDVTSMFEIIIRVGEHNLETKVDCDNDICAPPTVTYVMEEYIQHPQYDDRYNNYDLALVRVKGEMHWNDYVQPACLPLSCDLSKKTLVGERLVAAGFGSLQDAPIKKEARVLQKVPLHVVDPDICVGTYIFARITNTLIICAGGSQGGDLHKDVCHGDSGGPLIYRNDQEEPPRLYVVGVVSGGEACNSTKTRQAPGIYTRLASHMDWILDNIRE